LKESVILLKN